jgi:hypothetical protein
MQHQFARRARFLPLLVRADREDDVSCDDRPIAVMEGLA